MGIEIDQIRDSFARLEAEIADGPIVPEVTAAEIRAHLTSRYAFDTAMPLKDIVADVEQMLHTWQVQVTHPRYFGLSNPSVSVAGVVADTLVAMFNSQLANWRTSPAANEMERHTLSWLAAKLGMAPETIATFTSGGMEANLSAVVVALTKSFPEYGEHGLRSLKGEPLIYLTEEAHHGFNKIAHMVGLGRRSLKIIGTDAGLKMRVDELERRVAEDRRNGLLPFMVVGNVGTTAAGVIDPLNEMGHFCRRESLWFHADAAYGGAAVLAPSLRRHLAGIEMADSVTFDAHKWLSVPMGAGMFFCRDKESVARAFRSDITYMPARKGAGLADAEITFDPLTHSAQWSRRFIGLKLFMSLAERGEHGYAAMIEHQAQMGDLMRKLLAASGWRIVNETPLPVICFTRDGLLPSELLAAMRERQTAWMSEASLGGVPVMRACVTSFKTTEQDVRDVVSAINALVSEMAECAVR